jgi:hypothetical protein
LNLCGRAFEGRERLKEELDRERRRLMRAHEERLARYAAAAAGWAEAWPETQRMITHASLERAHEIMVERASECLPRRVKQS